MGYLRKKNALLRYKAPLLYQSVPDLMKRCGLWDMNLNCQPKLTFFHLWGFMEKMMMIIIIVMMIIIIRAKGLS